MWHSVVDVVVGLHVFKEQSELNFVQRICWYILDQVVDILAVKLNFFSLFVNLALDSIQIMVNNNNNNGIVLISEVEKEKK